MMGDGRMSVDAKFEELTRINLKMRDVEDDTAFIRSGNVDTESAHRAADELLELALACLADDTGYAGIIGDILLNYDDVQKWFA